MLKFVNYGIIVVRCWYAQAYTCCLDTGKAGCNNISQIDCLIPNKTYANQISRDW